MRGRRTENERCSPVGQPGQRELRNGLAERERVAAHVDPGRVDRNGPRSWIGRSGDDAPQVRGRAALGHASQRDGVNAGVCREVNGGAIDRDPACGGGRRAEGLGRAPGECDAGDPIDVGPVDVAGVFCQKADSGVRLGDLDRHAVRSRALARGRRAWPAREPRVADDTVAAWLAHGPARRRADRIGDCRPVASRVAVVVTRAIALDGGVFRRPARVGARCHTRAQRARSA